MKKVMFQLTQRNGNVVSFMFESLPEGITQDQFAGTYLFPSLLRLVKGASKMFDKDLPVYLSFSAETIDTKVLANLKIKSASVMAVRRAVLTFNEAIAALAGPTATISAYDLIGMKGNRGGEYRDYAARLLRPSVSLEKALTN